MKKALSLLVALGTLSALSLGCAVTDYKFNGDTFGGFALADQSYNLSHGIIECSSQDRIANSQQTLEGETRGLVYTSGCAGVLNPIPGATLVSRSDAKAWNRFLGSSTQADAGVGFGCARTLLACNNGGGVVLTAGVKNMPNGDVRLNNYRDCTGTGGTTPFWCGNDGCANQGGSWEGAFFPRESDGGLAGYGLTNRPNTELAWVAVDSATGPPVAPHGFCNNIVAMSTSPGVNNALGNLIAFNVPVSEQDIINTPVTRTEAFASIIAGTPTTVNLPSPDYGDLSVTLSAELLGNGRMNLLVHDITVNQASATFATPMAFEMSMFGAPRMQLDVPVGDPTAEWAQLAQVMIDGGLVGAPISFARIDTSELGGLQLPDVDMLMLQGYYQNIIDNYNANLGGQDGTGLGG